MEIPVYVFTGFLESGKTKMVHETMADKRFQDKERTLIILCEEGIEEYDPSEYSGEVFLEVIDEPEDLTTEKLQELLKKHKAERVMVELNGMWMASTLYDALPEDWFPYQEVMCVDSATFKTYNANMRALMFDKLQGASVVFFNRCTPETDIMALHSAVRAVSRRVGIIYEYTDGKIEQDNIEDPLPFDINAPVIEISERDYAIWYRDMAEDLSKYEDKTIKVKGMTVRDEMLKKNEFAFGRMVMTCCADDTTFHGIVTVADCNVECNNGEWFTVTATFKKEKHKMYKGVGPVFHLISMEKSEAPSEPVATFD
ncbi:MAG: GTPase [Clostridia bacterium]|nr:GTPase [Clostridia bacterium]